MRNLSRSRRIVLETGEDCRPAEAREDDGGNPHNVVEQSKAVDTPVPVLGDDLRAVLSEYWEAYPNPDAHFFLESKCFPKTKTILEKELYALKQRIVESYTRLRKVKVTISLDLSDKNARFVCSMPAPGCRKFPDLVDTEGRKYPRKSRKYSFNPSHL